MELHPQRGYKSLPQLPMMVTPEFVVITGENGAGKSQFLEAIFNQTVLTSYGGDAQSVRYLTSEQLGAPQEFAGGEEPRDQQVARFESLVRQIDQIRSQSPFDTAEGARNGVHSYLKQSGLSDQAIFALEALTPTPIADWTHEDFAEHTPIEFGGLDPFVIRVGDIFSRYSQILMSNTLNRFRADQGESVAYKTEAEFQSEFGKPPWDLFNSALESVGLRYRFSAPTLSPSPMIGPPELTDPLTGTRLNVSMLSTGERALLSIAMSIYSVANRRSLMRMPSLVLLDEPDATLHPSMIRSLINLLLENFVRDLGVGVIMTTHSPTTVALAPDESIYVMYKDRDPRLQPAASKDHALSHLLVGVPTVSVSSENRRVVIVESPHDERRYTAIETLLNAELGSERSLVFMAAGGTGATNGASAVLDLVTRLRSNGNVLVWGLIDRDDLAAEPHSNVFLNPERYTAENFVLDPLSVGLLLLSEPHAETVAVLAPIDFVSFDLTADAQSIADYVVSKIAESGDDMSTAGVSYVGGTQVAMPRFWLDMRGHDLSARIFSAFPQLNVYRDENRLMDAVIGRVWASRPGVVPVSIRDTFFRLLS